VHGVPEKSESVLWYWLWFWHSGRSEFGSWSGQWALQLLIQMGSFVVTDVFSFNAEISAFEKGARWQRALKLFAEMYQAGVVRNTITYNATISACEKRAQWQRASELFAEMAQCCNAE